MCYNLEKYKNSFDITLTKKSYLNHLDKGDIEPIESQFKLSYNTVINLVRQHSKKQSIHIFRCKKIVGKICRVNFCIRS